MREPDGSFDQASQQGIYGGGRAGEEYIVKHHHHIFILHMVYALGWHI